MERLKKIGDIQAYCASDIASSRLGIGFEKLDRDAFDPELAYDQVAALGVKWVRIQSGWAKTEKRKHEYDFAWLDAIVDNLLRRGLQPWMCLCYGNALYTEAAKEKFRGFGCPPVKTGEERTAWCLYAAAVARHFAGRVRWYEVWNEPDGDSCWSHGADAAEYGEFLKLTAQAVREGDPAAKIIGGALTIHKLDWLSGVLKTSAGDYVDAISYHNYCPDENEELMRYRSLRGLTDLYRKDIELIQGETGCPSRGDGAGAMCSRAWNERRQATFLLRFLLTTLTSDVKFTSFFSAVDMIEDLQGKGDAAVKQVREYGRFGLLRANLDERGNMIGNYEPKISYRAMQVLAALFHGSFTVAHLPVMIKFIDSPRIGRRDDQYENLMYYGFRRPNGAAAFAYWHASEILTTSYESTVTIEIAGMNENPRLIDMMDGGIYEIPEAMTSRRANSILLKNMPILDHPLLLDLGKTVHFHEL